jgi:hypothetical protein
MERIFAQDRWLGRFRRGVRGLLAGVDGRLGRRDDRSAPEAAAFAPTAGDGAPVPELSLAWLSLYRAARAGLAAGRITEAQVLLLECLAELEEILEAMPADEQQAYCRRHEEVAAALALQRRSSRGSSPS